MAQGTVKGNPVALSGAEVKPNQPAPDFSAVDTALQPVRLSGARGKVLILSSVPSLDTPVCDTETRRLEGLQLQLRTRAGVPADALDASQLPGLVEEQGGRLVLTRAGRLVANEVALRLR